MCHLTVNNLLSSAQHGFLKARSCDTCQLSFFDYVLQSRDNGFALYTVYFDFTKAFDRVDHALLLLKLSSFGKGDELLKFISSYLGTRTQRVKISNAISNLTCVKSGVIQGSVLGPLLFCLFVNDVPDLFQNALGQVTEMDFHAFRRVLSKARKLLVVTGAGISAESGVPTFRGEEAFAKNPSLVWEFYHYRRELVRTKSPNAGHGALAKLEQLFTTANRSFLLATQNVDGLHERAGSKNLVELHGSLFKVRCTRCNKVSVNTDSPICSALSGRGAPEVQENPVPTIPVDQLPRCAESGCGGLLRPHVVWFGEPLNPLDLDRANTAALEADVCLVVGSSSVVYPAAGLALTVAERGFPVAEVNVEPTPATSLVQFYFEGKAGTVLPELIDSLELD
ncbi:NAD-dependent protein deacylase sirtuin-5, mitochondrial [Sparganum proliferum]